MISEGSWDTEDWINAENTAVYILKYIIVILNCNNVSQYYDHINVTSVIPLSITLKNALIPNFYIYNGFDNI